MDEEIDKLFENLEQAARMQSGGSDFDEVEKVTGWEAFVNATPEDVRNILRDMFDKNIL